MTVKEILITAVLIVAMIGIIALFFRAIIIGWLAGGGGGGDGGGTGMDIGRAAALDSGDSKSSNDGGTIHTPSSSHSSTNDYSISDGGDGD